MPHAFARRARAAAPKPGTAARKPAARPSAGLPAYLKSGVNVVRPDAPAEQEADSVARAIAGGGNAWGAGRAGGTALARAPQLPAKPEEKKPEAPVKKAAKVEPEKKPEAPVKRATQAPDPLSKKDDEPAPPIKRAEKAPGAEGIEDKMKMPVARLAREDAGPEAAPEEEPVALKARGEAEGETGAADEAQAPAIALAAAAASPGRPLTPTMRALLEQRLGADLAHVRLHDDRAAQEAADTLEARAYTQGADVYLGRGESEGDTELIAHEVTHVLQNDAGAPMAGAPAMGGESGGEGVARKGKVPLPTKEESGKYVPKSPGLGGDARDKMLREYTPPADDPANGWQGDVFRAPGLGELDVGGRKITLDKIKVPAFKKQIAPAGPYKRARGLRDTKQASTWLGALAKDAASESAPLPQAVVKALSAPPGKPVEVEGQPTYFGKGPAGDAVFVGTGAQIATGMFQPRWGSSGGARNFDIDHQHDTQLGGPDAVENMWLLDADANQSAGRMMMQDIRMRIGGLLVGASRATPPVKVPEAGKVLPSVEKKKDAKADDKRAVLDWPIEIKELESGGGPATPARWLKEDIAAGKPAEHLKPLNPRSNEFKDLLGDKKKKRYSLMTQLYGGRMVPIPVGPKGAIESVPKSGIWGVKFDSMTLNDDMGGEIGVTIWANSGSMKAKKDTLTIEPRPQLGYGGAIDSRSLQVQVYEAKGLSKVTFSTLTIGDKGLDGVGLLEPSLDILQGIPINVVAKAGKVSAFVTIDAGALTLPKPFVVESANVTLGFRDDKLFAEGNLNFLVEKFGKGEVKVSVDTKTGLEAEGKFEIDPKLVSSSTIKAWYRDGSFGGEGDARIDGKKLKGVKEASLHILFDKDKFEASGALKPDLPSVTEAGVSVKYDREKDLLTVGGKVALGAMPGISGGSLDVTATQKDEGWSLKGTGSLTPKIPGIESAIGIVYDDGLFTADATVKFAKGKLSGSAHLVVSNAEIVDGKPGKEKSDKISFWGEGSAGLQITPWLKGTASIVFKPDGTFDVSGEIATDKAIELLKPAKKFDKKIDKSVKITLAGIPRAGLYARIGGGVEIGASAGPVVLDQVSVKVDFSNSSGDLSVTGVKGKARLSIPAEASTKFFLKIALGAEVLIAYAEGSLTGSITAAIKGGLFQDIDVDWTPQQGLSISTEAKAVFKPVVTLALTGGLEVGLDLVLKNVTLYEESWELGSFSFGSDMEFGIKADASYKETEGFKLGEIKPILPDLDIGAIGRRAIDAVL